MTPTLSWYGMYPEAERSAAPLLLLLLLLPLLIKKTSMCLAGQQSPMKKSPNYSSPFPSFSGK